MTVSEVLQSEMTAIAITEPGGPDVLQPQTMALPEPAAGEVLIKVAAAGVNRPDVIQRMGFYPVPPGASPLPGLEVSGTVVALGQGVEPEWMGRKVCALTNGGGYAEFCVAPATQCLSVPDSLTMAEAAALPET
ncbi:alcohol dehydrogenase catalytic domain-containing protein, partial [Parasphingorhabdus sp.]